MEWETPVFAKYGQHRERIMFAWTPVYCEDGMTRWLCKVRVLEITGGEDKWDIVKYYRANVEDEKPCPTKSSKTNSQQRA